MNAAPLEQTSLLAALPSASSDIVVAPVLQARYPFPVGTATRETTKLEGPAATSGAASGSDRTEAVQDVEAVHAVEAAHHSRGEADQELGVEVLGLDAAATLTFLRDQQRVVDTAEAAKLRAATHWADLHRVRVHEEVGALDPDIARTFGPDEGLHGREGELRLAGEGAFSVNEYAVSDLAAVLGLPEVTARALVGQALELRDRLPRHWARVMAGDLPAWRARRVADRTLKLSAVAAAWVDAQIAAFAHNIGPTRLDAAVTAAVQRWDPVEAATLTAEAADRRGVWTRDTEDGNTDVHVVTGTPEARAFERAVSRLASALGDLGDSSSLQARRALAVGILAEPDLALELSTPGCTDPITGDSVRAPSGSATTLSSARPSRAGNGLGGPSLHIHLHQDAVSGVVPAGESQPAGHVARVAGVGPRALGVVEHWIRDLHPGATVTVTPVVDTTENIVADAYESTRLRNQVEHRDTTCMFPWCGNAGRFDLDHVNPWVDRRPERPDVHPPPGQSCSGNAARLCRFHHRLKTHGSWGYDLWRDPGGAVTLTWTSPHGRTYTVDSSGTIPRS